MRVAARPKVKSNLGKERALVAHQGPAQITLQTEPFGRMSRISTASNGLLRFADLILGGSTSMGRSLWFFTRLALATTPS